MKVIILGSGTSQGVPVIACSCAVCQSTDFRDQRLRSSIYVETEDVRFVIDTGADFRQQMLRENIKQVEAVLLTHHHKDHTAGLDDVRAFNFANEQVMPIYGSVATLDRIKIEYSYAFDENRYPGAPQLSLFPIGEQEFFINKTKIIPLPVLHHKMPVLGFRIHNFSYITDANFISDDTMKKIEGSEVLILNALHHNVHLSHFNLAQAIDVAKRSNAKKAFFTHISHLMGLHRDEEKKLPKNMHLAYDGLTLML